MHHVGQRGNGQSLDGWTAASWRNRVGCRAEPVDGATPTGKVKSVDRSGVQGVRHQSRRHVNTRRRLLILLMTPVVVYGVVALLGPPLSELFLAQVFADLVDQSMPMDVDPKAFRLLGALLAVTATIRTATEFWGSGHRATVRWRSRQSRSEPSIRLTAVNQRKSEATPTCSCGAVMVMRHRRSDGSPFWGCSRFPACRQTRAGTGAR